MSKMEPCVQCGGKLKATMAPLWGWKCPECLSLFLPKDASELNETELRALLPHYAEVDAKLEETLVQLKRSEEERKASGAWKLIDRYDNGQPAAQPWFELEIRSGKIYLESRPAYCDRGRYYAKVDVWPDPAFPGTYIDKADGWPRYYFDLERAKLELEAWAKKRGLWQP